ncbi:spermidine/putrescine ABC transporter ATP-binding protein, partial [Vibrio parahaemolyticus]|nr:spermidine/putrescine ABC transporter ATP-binding protein [Vibrio parahaemolyticus]
VESVGHFIVKVPNDNRKHLQLTPGSICRIGWQSDDCHALDGTQTQSSEVAA